LQPPGVERQPKIVGAGAGLLAGRRPCLQPSPSRARRSFSLILSRYGRKDRCWTSLTLQRSGAQPRVLGGLRARAQRKHRPDHCRREARVTPSGSAQDQCGDRHETRGSDGELPVAPDAISVIATNPCDVLAGGCLRPFALRAGMLVAARPKEASSDNNERLLTRSP